MLYGLEQADNLRRLTTLCPDGKWVWSEAGRYLNFSSNDYLGLSDAGLQARFFEELASEEVLPQMFVMSNPSSRLMTGNSPEYARLESSLGGLYPGKTVLVAGSGYLANTGVLPALTGHDDVVLADKLVHASLIDGMRLCEAAWTRFRHNDMEHLESLLRKHRDCRGEVWVVTESVFSMDGDRAPLGELMALKERYGFRLYLDEAHAFGVYGSRGEGCAAEAGVAGRVDVIVATLGKALSSCGAFVVTDALTREVLVNRMRTLIFSTALPPVSLLWSDFLVSRLEGFASRREHLHRLTALFDGAQSHIVPLMAHDNARALEMASALRDEGYWTTAIRYPTVPRGAARVRVSLGAALDTDDVKEFINTAKKIMAHF